MINEDIKNNNPVEGPGFTMYNVPDTGACEWDYLSDDMQNLEDSLTTSKREAKEREKNFDGCDA